MDENKSESTEGVELSADVLKKLSEAGAQLGPEESKVFFRTLADLQKAGKKLPPVEYVWDKLAQMAYYEMKMGVEQANLREKDIQVPIRVNDWVFTKKNRIRLVPGNHSSPMGVVIKGDKHFDDLHRPYACAWFYAHELFRFAVDQLNELPAGIPSAAVED